MPEGGPADPCQQLERPRSRDLLVLEVQMLRERDAKSVLHVGVAGRPRPSGEVKASDNVRLVLRINGGAGVAGETAGFNVEDARPRLLVQLISQVGKLVPERRRSPHGPTGGRSAQGRPASPS
jgi:hypothetical protein